MIERLKHLPAGVLGVRASGRVGRQDYEEVVEPLFESLHRHGERVRFLFHFAPTFTGFTPGGVWEDAKVGFRYLRLFERCAVVSDREWLRVASRAIGAVVPVPVRVYDECDLEAALLWLGAEDDVGLTFRLVAGAGVLVLEPRHALRVEDFDAVAAAIDPWIDGGGMLAGIVVHAREFPGWESIGALLRHVRFVRQHHRKVARVAVAIDGHLPGIAAAIGDHFVAAEVEHFGYDDLRQAIDWAGAAASA